MDDCHHEPPPFHPMTRKRKADADDRALPPVAVAVAADPANAAHAAPDALLLNPSATPRMPADSPDVAQASANWLLAQHLSSWQESPGASSSRSFAAHTRHDGPSKPKRPRIEIPQSIPVAPRKSRRGRVLYSSNVSSPRKLSRYIRSPSLRDTGVVSAVEPRRLAPLQTGGLTPQTSPARSSLSLPVTPIEPSYAHVPPHQPPVNRDTLKELDLDAILRNPQLRHDLLFDPGLQFRPTCSRRKRDMAEKYWVAVVRELETGCTCTTLDIHGKPLERRCICRTIPLPAEKAIRAYAPADHFVTVRSPSRVQPLLAELLAVLVSIIRPVAARPTGVCLHPGLAPPQEQNDAHVAYLRSIVDVELIPQEIAHGVFDPSGVFKAIGDIMRCYCAPMRDPAVNQMVALAASCSPGGAGTKADAVHAIRMCFDILELMKLDVANHQLQTLRPYLVHTAAQFELKMFQENRQKSPLTLETTRRWLQAAFDELATQNVDPRPSASLSLHFARYPRNTQIQVAVVHAVVNLIFDGPAPAPCSPSPSPPSSPLPSSAARSRYPETLYLDHVRLATLRNDAADFTTLYMLLLLYRQLAHSGAAPPRAAVAPDDLLALKKEIWEIGPARLGFCFACRPPSGLADAPGGAESAAELARWRRDMDDVVLQLTTRASLARARPAPTPPPTDLRPLPAHAPDSALLKLATSWTDSHLRADSPLSALMRRRIKAAVADLATQFALPGLAAAAPSAQPSPFAQPSPSSSCAASGLEPLMPEIRHLAEKLAKLVAIHLNVYGALYAQPGFVLDAADAAPLDAPPPARAAPP